MSVARHTIRISKNPLFRIMSSKYFMWFYDPDSAIKTLLFAILIKDVSTIFSHVSTYASVDSDKRIFFCNDQRTSATVYALSSYSHQRYDTLPGQKTRMIICD